jgi:aspartyl-tRNA(Asn)/glutamyl-tRNA(Gln) amidotransferase subunit A
VTEQYENTRGRFRPEVKRRVMIGTYVLSAGYYDAYYVRAQKDPHPDQARLRGGFCARRGCDLTPATPSAAFGIGEKGSDDPVEMYLNDVFHGHGEHGRPARNRGAGRHRPSGAAAGAPAHRPPFEEETLFAAGQAIEDAAGRMALPQPWWA